jgi:hypothetical protein
MYCCCQQSYNVESITSAAETGKQACKCSSFTAWNYHEIILEETKTDARGAYVIRRIY